jgi:hypothetical protein
MGLQLVGGGSRKKTDMCRLLPVLGALVTSDRLTWEILWFVVMDPAPLVCCMPLESE